MNNFTFEISQKIWLPNTFLQDPVFIIGFEEYFIIEKPDNSYVIAEEVGLPIYVTANNYFDNIWSENTIPNGNTTNSVSNTQATYRVTPRSSNPPEEVFDYMIIHGNLQIPLRQHNRPQKLKHN